MTSQETRQQFLTFYERRDHANVASSPVVPLADPTLLFTNAGMNQFKDVFLGSAHPESARAANSQKCIRAGGKHNDLDDVGHDNYHLTFFEMLGTWSFGDYFKEDSIRWGWELLTEVWGIPAERLHATYFAGDESDGVETDLEARDLWLDVTGIDPRHVHPFGRKDNFWEMADVGPCGPSSEIHVDMTPDLSGGALVNADDARVFEIWNHVFIQFNRNPKGVLAPLAARHVDTGMGFERLLTVLQGKRDAYETDLFTPILEAIREVTGAPAYGATLPSRRPTEDEMRDVALRIVADHLRCLTFAITDGALPDNEGRGYVLRRILRRAYRYGRQFLGARKPFVHRLVPALVEVMGDAFPEIRRARDRVAEVIGEEEETFAATLEQGLKLFHVAAARAAGEEGREINAEAAFKLHDTYGFPIDLTTLMAEERQLEVDLEGYKRLMETAREKARRGGRSTELDAAQRIFQATANSAAAFFKRTRTDDVLKYRATQLDARMVGWVDEEGRFHETPLTGAQECAVLTGATCFYAEQGGQVGDTGRIIQGDGVFEVIDTRRLKDTILHLGRLRRGRLEPGRRLRLKVSSERRSRIMANHTATHLLNLALREVLGARVQQKGSLVDAAKTRFDFGHGSPPSHEEIERIEAAIGRRVSEDFAVDDREMSLQEALAIRGIRAVFGEKYPDAVRVVSIGVPVADLAGAPDDERWMDYSVELCGGTHLSSTAQVGAFVLVAEEAIARGTRRVVGVSGEAARQADEQARRLQAEAERLSEAPAHELGPGLAELADQIARGPLPITARHRLQEKIAELQSVVKSHREEEAAQHAGESLDLARRLLERAEKAGGATLVVGDIPGATPQELRRAFDFLRDKEGSVAAVLFAAGGGKVALLAGLSKDLVGRGLDANRLLREVAPLVGGRGGGRPDMAQGGGQRADQVPTAIDKALGLLRAQLE